ncbi:dipeptidase, partial [Acidobacteriota bacterium]
MSKKWLSLLAAIFITALYIPSLSHSLDEEGIEKLHRDAVVWDCHSDLVLRVLYEGLDIGDRLPVGHVDIPRLKEGQVDVQVMALFVQNFLYPDKCDEQALRLIEIMTDAIDKHSESAEIARTGKDIDRILKSGKIAMPLSIEGGHAIEDDIKNLQKFHSLGVSSMTVT